MPEVLVVGCGHLGHHLIRDLNKDGIEVSATHFNTQPRELGVDSTSLDIRHREAVGGLIGEQKPKTVVHCAAVSDVEWAHKYRPETTDINLFGARNVADACEKVGARMIYISTDYVFDGYDTNYTEKLWPRPINHYGHTKLLGEQQVEKRSIPTLIFRPSTLYSHLDFPNNYLLRLIAELKAGNRVQVIDDAKRSVTGVADLSAAIRRAIKTLDEKPELANPGGPESIKAQQNAVRPGLYHVAGPEAVTRQQFAQRVAKLWSLNEGLLDPIHLRELDSPVERPLDSSLDSSKFSSDFGFTFPSLDESLQKVKAEISG